MNTKIKTMAVILAAISMFFFNSCKKDEDTVAKPAITVLEVGLGNSHVAYAGADLHIEADIVAEGKINKITVEIHQEEGSADEIVAEYTEFAGLKNTTFHKHVEIPGTTAPGTYHCHIIVTDMEGNSTTAEDEIEIQELVDITPPVFSDLVGPTVGQVFINGQTITLSGHVDDNITLGGILIALVYADDNIADADVTGENAKVIVMLHSHDFGDDPDEYDFNASIAVGAAMDNNMTPASIQGDNAWKSGNYYILARCQDAKSNWVFSSHYPVVINL